MDPTHADVLAGLELPGATDAVGPSPGEVGGLPSS
jgi:hypothetical protein